MATCLERRQYALLPCPNVVMRRAPTGPCSSGVGCARVGANMDGNAARLATVLATDVLLLPTVALTVLLPAEKATRERARKAACLSTREKRTNGIRPQNRTPWGRYLNADAILKIPCARLSCPAAKAVEGRRLCLAWCLLLSPFIRDDHMPFSFFFFTGLAIEHDHSCLVTLLMALSSPPLLGTAGL